MNDVEVIIPPDPSIPEARPVTIGICTSALRCNIEAFITKVSGLDNVTTRFIELPYNDIDSFSLPRQELDGVILCHSINNRRFAITNVMDALYDRFLPRVAKTFGKDNVCVIAHDFPWPMASPHEDHILVKDTNMESFRKQQPTTFQCCNLALICGRLDTQVDMDEEDWKKLVSFLYQCQVTIPQSISEARPVTIGICTSALRCNIEDFITKVSGLDNVTTRFIELPYNAIDSFNLPQQELDGVILCHSINNRRFAITDVMDALYDTFLPRVAETFGKDNVCVIAHDFPWPMASPHEDHILVKDTNMESFQRQQPTTFQCCNLALICGRLDTQVDMDEEDWKKLVSFLYQCQVKPQAHSWDYVRYLLYAIGGMVVYVLFRIRKAFQSVCGPVQDNASGPVVKGSHTSQGFVGSILWLVWFPFKCVLNTIGFMWSLTRPGSVGYTLWTSFKEEVINKTLERPKSQCSLFRMVYWICALPSKFVFNSCWFAVTLVRKWARSCVVGVGKYVGVMAAVFFMIPIIGKAYYTQGQDVHTPGNEMVSRDIAHWHRAPWWKVPHQFWRHYFHVGYTRSSHFLSNRMDW